MQKASRQSMWTNTAAESAKVLILDQGIDLRTNNVMLPDNDMTISFHARCMGEYGVNDRIYLFGWAELSWGGTGFCFSSGGWNFRYATGNSSTNYTDWNNPPVTAYGADKKWHYYCFRKNGQTITVDIDCQRLATKTTARAHANDRTPLSIGRQGTWGSVSYSESRGGVKSIARFCVFSRAISDAEMAEFSTGKSIKKYTDKSNMVCGYDLDTDSMLADYVNSPANDLTMYNYSNVPVRWEDNLSTKFQS